MANPTREEMVAKLAEWIGEITDQAPPKLTTETHLVNDLALDSLALAELAAMVRSRFQVKIRAAEFADRLEVRSVIELVEQKLKEQGGK